MAEKFSIELLDIAYLCAPSMVDIEKEATADRIAALRGDPENKWSYDPAFSRFNRSMRGATLSTLIDELKKLKRNVQSKSCVDVFNLLRKELADGAIAWVPYQRIPMQLFDQFFFRGVARGILQNAEGRFSTFVNPRKSMPNDPLANSFFARGAFEAHLRDEPSLDGGLVLNLSSPRPREARKPAIFQITDENMMPLDQFDHVCRVFFDAAVAAGYLSEAPKERHFGDLFRKASRI